jgi:hypothetical protein
MYSSCSALKQGSALLPLLLLAVLPSQAALVYSNNFEGSVYSAPGVTSTLTSTNPSTRFTSWYSPAPRYGNETLTLSVSGLNPGRIDLQFGMTMIDTGLGSNTWQAQQQGRDGNLAEYPDPALPSPRLQMGAVGGGPESFFESQGIFRFGQLRYFNVQLFGLPTNGGVTFTFAGQNFDTSAGEGWQMGTLLLHQPEDDPFILPVEVPEPSTLGLLAVGLAAVAVWRRR